LSLAAQGRMPEAVAVWQSVPGMASELLQSGHYAREQKQYDVAMQWYTWAAKLRPDWRDPVYYAGLTQAQWERSEAAIPYYETAVTLPFAPDDVTDAEIYCALGWVYHWLRDPRDPEQALAYYDLALTEEISNDPLTNQCLFKRAELLLWSRHDFTRAVQDYEFIREHEPQNVEVWANLAFARYRQTGDVAMAEAELTAVTYAFPQSVWGYWRLADVYREAGRVDEARNWYAKALVIAPENTAVQSQLERLKQP
jgi:tetratricopeptide (TPR) repeat protein